MKSKGAKHYKVLRLRYRVVTFDGEVPAAALDTLAAEFRK